MQKNEQTLKILQFYTRPPPPFPRKCSQGGYRTAGCLNHVWVWPFSNIIHERVKTIFRQPASGLNENSSATPQGRREELL